MKIASSISWVIIITACGFCPVISSNVLAVNLGRVSIQRPKGFVQQQHFGTSCEGNGESNFVKAIPPDTMGIFVGGATALDHIDMLHDVILSLRLIVLNTLIQPCGYFRERSAKVSGHNLETPSCVPRQVYDFCLSRVTSPEVAFLNLRQSVLVDLLQPEGPIIETYSC
jgi:hypothetical protein